MAIDVDDSGIVKVVDNVLSAREVRVKNTGPDAVVLSKDPAVTAAAGFGLALDGQETVWLSPGEALYAVCDTGDNAALGVL